MREGHWGAAGGIGRMEDVATLAGVHLDGHPTERGERLRTAIETADLVPRPT